MQLVFCQAFTEYCIAWFSVRKVRRFGVPVRSPLDNVNI
jgi:hypothetical protein